MARDRAMTAWVGRLYIGIDYVWGTDLIMILVALQMNLSNVS